MKVLTFIRQASFAKYIMADIYYAVRRLGWEAKFEDLEQFVRETKELPDDEQRKKVDSLLNRIDNYNPDIVFSYGLEYCANPFKELQLDDPRPFYQIINKPAVFFFFTVFLSTIKKLLIYPN